MVLSQKIFKYKKLKTNPQTPTKHGRTLAALADCAKGGGEELDSQPLIVPDHTGHQVSTLERKTGFFSAKRDEHSAYHKPIVGVLEPSILVFVT